MGGGEWTPAMWVPALLVGAFMAVALVSSVWHYPIQYVAVAAHVGAAKYLRDNWRALRHPVHIDRSTSASGQVA